MSRELPRLLHSYEFLKAIRRQHGSQLPTDEAQGLENRIDRVFLDILRLESHDPHVTAAQARFLLSSMADLIPDVAMREALQDACKRHLDRLDKHLAPPPSSHSSTEPLNYRYLDSLGDRVAVVDAQYCYVFTNKANAAFHGVDAADFLGAPNWQVVGARFFEAVNKPRFDACLAGRSESFITPHPLADPNILHAVNIDPVRNATGAITEIVITCRNVSNLPIPPEMITLPP